MTSSSQTRSRVPRRADSAERVYRVIRSLAMDFRLRPDERINEVQLARQLDVSRTPVREALNRLASEGFLGFQPNRGFFFRAPDIDILLKLFELRTVIEQGGFALACARASDEAIAGVEAFWSQALERYRHEDADEILALDEQFHMRLAQLAGNEEIVGVLESVNARIRFVRRIQIAHGKQHPKSVIEHTRIVEALKARDAEAGKQLLQGHISLTVDDATVVMKEAFFKLYAETANGSESPEQTELGRSPVV
ncbi:GntR family transcriptional regulator [Rhodoligotrophos defluvii]|uniref:GntR family transcriptional regulator n=1 Tax=Rhodoligotrophos defluvii TaxID=2561934 RepID=UPI0010C9D62D|nr:GntR family transcriptional regulator [Rhodoligotrophos defluvii]